MDRGTWKKPVILEMCGHPGLVIISDTLDAALMLLGAWPANRSDAHIAAVMSCRDVLAGTGSPGLARADFIGAALEAGYLIQPETFLANHWREISAPDDEPGTDVGHSGVEAREKPHSGISWTTQSLHVFRTNRTGMLELLIRLAEVLGMIFVETCKGAASLLNIGVRPRPDREMR
jgi:hypothetical protein